MRCNMDNYCKILIIDDEFIMRQGMKHMLNWEQEGFQIVGEASNGREGLELVETLAPHIVLADIVMPQLDGMEFSRILQEKHPEIQLIILSGYDKFEYVKTALLNGAMDYILKPALNPDILLAALKKAAERIPGMVLVRGEMVDYSRIMERYILGFDEKLDKGSFQGCFPNSCFRLFGTDLKQVYGNHKAAISQARGKVWDFMNGQKSFDFLQVETDQKTLLYVVNYRASREEEVRSLLTGLADSMALGQERSFFVMGSRFTDLSEIRQVYREELLPWSENGFYFKGSALIFPEELKAPEKDLEKFDFTGFSANLRNRKYEDALYQMSRYLQRAVETRMDVYRLKNLAKNLLYNFLVSLEEFQLDMEDLRRKYFLKLDEAPYVQEFLEVLKETAEEFRKFFSESGSSTDRTIREILAFISDHYAEPLELKEVADRFNFNYHYLSSYFNSRAHESFSDYLNKLRIEKACGLLKESRTPISEVSSRVGYSDHSYFCRVFKKQTGYTPSAYRRHYR